MILKSLLYLPAFCVIALGLLTGFAAGQAVPEGIIPENLWALALLAGLVVAALKWLVGMVKGQQARADEATKTLIESKDEEIARLQRELERTGKKLE